MQGQRSDLADRLRTNLNDLKVDGKPVQQIPQIEDLTSAKLEKLQTVLSDRLSDAISQDMETMQELNRLEELLSQILGDLNEYDFNQNRFRDSQSDAMAAIEKKDFLKETPPSGQDAESGMGSSETGSSEQDGLNPAGKDRTPGKRLKTDDRAGSDQELPVAGREKSMDLEKLPYELEASKGPPIQDALTAAQGDRYSLQIRSVAGIGKKHGFKEDLVRAYQQEIESVLQKEDIPLNYREYIKNYFISIGLQRSENEPHNTQ